MTSRCGVSLHCGASPLSALSLLLLCAASSGVWGDAIPGLSPDPPQSDLTLPATRPELLHQYPWMTLPPLPDWPQPENGTGLFNLSWPWPIKLRPLPLPPLIPLTPLFPRSGGDNATQSGETTEATEQSSGDAEAASIFSQTSEQTSQTQSQPPNACQAGHFDRHGAGVCHPCPAGHWSPAGAYSCQTCPAFHGSLAGSAACSVLPVHTYEAQETKSNISPFDYELSGIACNPDGIVFHGWSTERGSGPYGRVYSTQLLPGMTVNSVGQKYWPLSRTRAMEATQQHVYTVGEQGVSKIELATGTVSHLALQSNAQAYSDLALHRQFETLYYRQTGTSVAWKQPSAGPGFVRDFYPDSPTGMDVDEEDGWLYSCTSNGLLTRVWPPSGFTQVFNWNSPASPIFATSWDMSLTKGVDTAWLGSHWGLFLATISDPPLTFQAPMPDDWTWIFGPHGYRITKGVDIDETHSGVHFTIASHHNPAEEHAMTVHAKFWKHGRFSVTAYERANPDVRALGLNGWEHYRDNGHAEGRDFWLDTGGHGVFDGQAYLDANEDVAAALLDPWEHYKQYGKSEGRIAYVL